ncbi:hypothetical protein A2858_03860 [Candidatus Daviesbacteria bacterium RIFCSPHIGHO2_01_FULL_36_37]|nr:MAG: hypothetical protein A2858_03860 [Candidatus Daviesbacteria bacterium RIFCSPHIGHO2_01_FULL_36_37]
MKKNLRDNQKVADYLTPLLEQAPATWALIRANEIKALDVVDFKHPILDVGCGDGFVAKVTWMNRKGKIDVGIDLSEDEVKIAKRREIYKKCLVGNVYELPFKNESFETVFSNSVVEHFPNLDQALSEMSRVLKKNGQFVITVPTPYLTKYLWGYQFFASYKLFGLARNYGKFFNFMFKHYNLYNHKEWEKILRKYSIKLKKHHYYHTQEMVQVHEFLAYLAVPYGISKIFFKHWIVFPSFRKIFVVPWLKKILYPYYLRNVKKDQGGSVLLVAIKV